MYTIDFKSVDEISNQVLDTTRTIRKNLQPLPVCVELPDNNYYGDPRLMMKQESHRKIQLIDRKTNNPINEL